MKSRVVCAITDVTPRQIQWWDERKFIKAARRGREREYTPQQVLEVAVAGIFRRKGIGCKAYRHVHKLIRSAIKDHDTPARYLIVFERHLFTEHESTGLARSLSDPSMPACLVVDLHHTAHILLGRLEFLRIPGNHPGIPKTAEEDASLEALKKYLRDIPGVMNR